MSFIAYTVLTIYTIALLYITIYCLMQINLLYHYKKGKRKVQLLEGYRWEKGNGMVKKAEAMKLAMAAEGDKELPARDQGLSWVRGEQWEQYPFVTVQLPIFNEMYVIERLIDCVTQFDYPKDRFEIHILDDSTDETVAITKAKVEEYRAEGFNIKQITRKKREGFKAGALKDAMSQARGEFMAIFDADFLPRPDFLKKTIPYFCDKKTGVVQTRWEHINEGYSLITRLQALQLNVHFTVEQGGRMSGGYMLQFNGTAGVWRREAIESAGGWQADTLTEDLDLSIRAQLKGWKIRYLEEVGSPAELPAEMDSFKSQQFRWMKGGAETAKKMLPDVWRSALSFDQKVHATSHLLGSTVFVFVFLCGIFSVPLLFFLEDLAAQGFSPHSFAWFLVGLLSIVAVYYAGNVQAKVHNLPYGRALLKFIFLFPLFLALSMGLSFHNSIAVVQGYIGKKSPFVRTPKFNIKTIRDSFAKSRYISKQLSWTSVFEGWWSLYFLSAVIMGIYVQTTTFIIFHLMLFLGYGAIFFYSMQHWKARVR